MVKNYLVCAVRPITGGWHLEKSQDLHEAYREMYELRLASFRRFCQEPFEAVLWTEPASGSDECTWANWNSIRDLWRAEPCNIFWAGADTFMTRPTDVFGRFQGYRLFNWTDPKSYGEFTNYFNDDIQYYPHDMSQEIWDLGEMLWQNRQGHPDQHWGFDQLRHNRMFWRQNIPDSDRHHPEMAWQAMRMRSLDAATVAWHEQWNQCAWDQAHILHFHASRGSRQVIDIMHTLSQQLGI